MVSIEDQWKRFTEDVPPHVPLPMPRKSFDAWASRYLKTEPNELLRATLAVKTPTGPFVEILRAWHGELAYDPARVQAPIAIMRGAWDGLVQDHDARWLLNSFHRAATTRDIKIGRATHLMHLEAQRHALWQESIAFLHGGADCAPDRSPTRSATRQFISADPGGPPAMSYENSPANIPGYNPGAPEVAHSPISMAEWHQLQASAFFTDADVVYLRLSYEVLKDQAQDLVSVWRGIIALHPHLKAYSEDTRTGEPDKEYSARVGQRFVQWVLDTAKAEYDQTWLDYQYEIGLRHHRSKKNQTDNAHTTTHIRGRDVLAFTAATVAPMRAYLEKGGHTPEIVNRMYDAWWKSMILQVTLWSQPYMNQGDF